MIYLFLVSLVWAFSFGLIKDQLAGIDPNLVSFIRLMLSFLFFLPFIKMKRLDRLLALKLLMTGAIQFGIMYAAYIYSFKFLKAYEVALFTIFTPLYVIIISDIFNKHFTKLFYLTSIFAVVGTGIIIYSGIKDIMFITGFLILQISNFAFAFGQIFYKKIMSAASGVKDIDVFALLFGGAAVITLLFTFISVNNQNISISSSQLAVLLYLGLIPSGIGFFLWNLGARKVNDGALAIMNNLKIPLAVFVSLIFFGEEADLERLILGGIVILISFLLNELLFSRKVLI